MKRTALFVFLLRLLAAISLTAGLSPAQARPTSWLSILEDTPFESFNEADQQLFFAAARTTLNDTPDHQPVYWKNPQTGRQGEILVLQSFASQGRPCRKLQVTNEAGRSKATSQLYLCKIGDQWKLVTESQLGR